MNKLKKILNFENIVFIIYFIVTLLLVLNHEYFEDEAQVWLIAKDLKVIEIIKQMQYEGHPCLWHLLINIFAELGFSYFIMGIISWVFGLFNVWLILKKSPFHKLVKIAFCFNITFLLYYSVIARSYSLVTSLILILSLIYPKRKEHPYLYGIIMALLINTHVLTCGLVGGLMLIDFYDIFIKKEKDNKKNRLLGIFIIIVGIVLLVLQLYKCFIVRNHSVEINLSLDIILKIFNILFSYFSFQCGNYMLSAIALMLFFILMYYIKKENKKMFFALLISLVFKILVHIFIYDLFIHHTGLLLLDLIFCLWIIFNEKNSKICSYLFMVILLLTLPYSLNFAYGEYTKKTTDSVSVSEFIIDNVNKNSEILCIDDNYCTAVMPYLEYSDYNFISYNTTENFTFVNWDVNSAKYTLDVEDINEVVINKNIDYIILDLTRNDIFKDTNLYKRVYSTDLSSVISGEKYLIYEVVDEDISKPVK